MELGLLKSLKSQEAFTKKRYAGLRRNPKGKKRLYLKTDGVLVTRIPKEAEARKNA